MRRFGLIAAIVLCGPSAYLEAHVVPVEAGREVVVLHTQGADGAMLETRLWIVDDGEHAWIHGNRDSAHQAIHELLREKYGIADWWVRLISNDEDALPVRLSAADL